MTVLKHDARLPRWIAAGYAAVAAGIVVAAMGAYALLERRARALRNAEIREAARNVASRLEREIAARLAELPEFAGEPYGEKLRPYFAEAVAIGSSGARLFPPAVVVGVPSDTAWGPEDVAVFERAAELAASGRDLEALELFGVAARSEEPAVGWSALLATASIYERHHDPQRALEFIDRALLLAVGEEEIAAARVRKAEILAAIDRIDESRAVCSRVLSDLAALVEGWYSPTPRSAPVETVRFLAEKCLGLLRGSGADETRSLPERLEEGLRSWERVEAVASRLQALRGAPGFVAVTLQGPAGPTAVWLFHRPRANGGREAFSLARETWNARARELAPPNRVGGVVLQWRLSPAEEPARGGAIARVSVGQPPLDSLFVEAGPTDEGALSKAVVDSRLRIGTAVGAVGCILLAASGLGARNLARAARLARARAEFALTTSHEIRTPLTLIRAAAETLATRPIDERSRRSYLRTVVVESRRLSDLLERVLDLRRLEEGVSPLEKSSQDLVDIAREAVEAFRPRLEEAAMQCDLQAEGPVPVHADPDALVNALLALLDNAVQYTPPDAELARRRIDIRVDRDRCRARLAVTDRGIGIPPGDRARVLESYCRLRSSLRSTTRGAGLGLSIVRHIASAHGGSVHIEDPPDGAPGTTIRLSLPLEDRAHG